MPFVSSGQMPCIAGLKKTGVRLEPDVWHKTGLQTILGREFKDFPLHGQVMGILTDSYEIFNLDFCDTRKNIRKK